MAVCGLFRHIRRVQNPRSRSPCLSVLPKAHYHSRMVVSGARVADTYIYPTSDISIIAIHNITKPTACPKRRRGRPMFCSPLYISLSMSNLLEGKGVGPKQQAVKPMSRSPSHIYSFYRFKVRDVSIKRRYHGEL